MFRLPSFPPCRALGPRRGHHVLACIGRLFLPSGCLSPSALGSRVYEARSLHLTVAAWSSHCLRFATVLADGPARLASPWAATPSAVGIAPSLFSQLHGTQGIHPGSGHGGVDQHRAARPDDGAGGGSALQARTHRPTVPPGAEHLSRGPLVLVAHGRRPPGGRHLGHPGRTGAPSWASRPGCRHGFGRDPGRADCRRAGGRPRRDPSLEAPYSETGGLAVLTGNLAPRGSVVKTASLHDMAGHTGAAVVFDSETEAAEAFGAGQSPAGLRWQRTPA